MTEREFWVKLLTEDAITSNPEYVEKINHMIERLDKKNARRSTKPSKSQLLSDEVRKVVLMEMTAEPHRVFTLTELAKRANEVITDRTEEITSQRVRYALTALLIDHEIITIKEGRKTSFQVVES